MTKPPPDRRSAARHHKPRHEKVDGPTSRLPEDAGGRAIVLRQFRLVVLEGDDAGREHVLDEPTITIGTDPENSVALADRFVSRFHAEILRKETGYLLRDLGSTNGTLVGEMAVKEAFLPAHCTLTIGHTRLAFIPVEEKFAIAPSRARRFGLVVGGSLVMRQLFGVLERFAATELPVLIEGETGTGKDLLARSIHAASPRAARPFVVLDCTSLPEALFESEVFGHEKGAFTGADAPRKGAFERADGGTLFIDEVGELPLPQQAKLLRVLESREVRPLGGASPRTVDVRIVSATNRGLRQMVRQGTFREDLFFRLAVVPLRVPPLRERREDIADIVETLRQEHAARLPPERAPLERFSVEALQALRARDWRGNVRELRNAVALALAFCQEAEVGPELVDLDRNLYAEEPRPPAAGATDRSLEEIEREAVAAALAVHRWNRKRVARILRISYPTMLAKIRKFGLTPGPGQR